MSSILSNLNADVEVSFVPKMQNWRALLSFTAIYLYYLYTLSGWLHSENFFFFLCSLCGLFQVNYLPMFSTGFRHVGSSELLYCMLFFFFWVGIFIVFESSNEILNIDSLPLIFLI